MSRYKNLIIALVIFVGFVIVSMVFISWFTKHGERLEVPKVEGLALAGAEELIDENSMELVIIDSVYNEEMKPFTIVEQDPKPGMMVKSGRKIYVTVNTGIKPKVKMPKLVNGSSNLASVLLRNAGLKLGRVDSVKSIFGTGLVIKQKYKNKEVLPNTMLDKGSIIDIVVSKMVSNSDTTALQNMRNGVEQKIQEDGF